MNFFGKITIPLLFIVPIFIGTMSFISDPRSDKTKLIIQFENFVGNELMKLDTVAYKNELGQTYSISKFKYYVGNFELRDKNGKAFTTQNYFLVDEEEKS